MRRSTPALDFPRAFGDGLEKFLRDGALSQADAARRLDLGKARLNTYFHDSVRGTRPTPSAEVLYRACAQLGFEFEYEGFRLAATPLKPVTGRQSAAPRQLAFQFEDQFNLTDEKGTVSVSFKRPAGRIELSISVKATA